MIKKLGVIALLTLCIAGCGTGGTVANNPNNNNKNEETSAEKIDRDKIKSQIKVTKKEDIDKVQKEFPNIKDKAVLKELAKEPQSYKVESMTELKKAPKVAEYLDKMCQDVLDWEDFKISSAKETEDYILNELKGSKEDANKIMTYINSFENWKRHAKARYEKTGNKEDLTTFSEIEQKFATGEYAGGIITY